VIDAPHLNAAAIDVAHFFVFRSCRGRFFTDAFFLADGWRREGTFRARNALSELKQLRQKQARRWQGLIHPYRSS
jgi:hypothetical protein